MTDYRAHSDFAISFANGGELSGTGFRLDLPSAEVSEAEIGRLLVQHLGLALVADVELRGLRIVAEPHRGSRGVDVGAAGTRMLRHPASSTSATGSGPGSSPTRACRRPSSRLTSRARTPARPTRRAPSSRWTSSR
ncbi:MAG: hypothetical protein LBE44_05615 [Microbacterium hominis]|uniref:hypothetical protein n=1 Tax=Microbacterium aurum TaxID=36805 RepID=UPI00248E807C|nr:hypothetical protein [Microbacterium aurum]MBZ6371372.1 hypothetical protein [Microbacterium hominis]